ncbi:hypothetical protein K435DRAFT_811702 [Dendrothele bispora CBS 962.96]|uniref:Uncharacterized protein n=1 Tax=Dendrothele bispora (strain CBS 962.96) TaxID=1314807 RepID=A0A4S8KR78_DENBC|nr:hypothetical protein K435DRAFT_811702 [Dendrothele bispora CBS 962.96]
MPFFETCTRDLPGAAPEPDTVTDTSDTVPGLSDWCLYTVGTFAKAVVTIYATLSQTVRSKISLPTPMTTYTITDYLALLGNKSVFEMAHYKSTAQNPFGGLQAFLNNYWVLFSPSTLWTYHKEDLINLATRVKDIFGLVNAWTANDKNALPLIVDWARLTVFCNLRDAYEPSIFDQDAELRSWVQEEEEKALDQGLAHLVSLAECKFGRLEVPFLTTTTNEDGAEESVEPDHSAINFGPPEEGEKFYLSPPIASSCQNPFTRGDGASTSKPPPIPPKPTQKSALLGSETKTGAATPSNATKTVTATRSVPGTKTSTRTTEPVRVPHELQLLIWKFFLLTGLLRLVWHN